MRAFGVAYLIPEEVAALEALAETGGPEAALAVKRLIAKGDRAGTQGPTLVTAVEVTAPLGSDLPSSSHPSCNIGTASCARICWPTPELSKSIIEPLKSQGVDAMGEDGSVQVRLKVMTKPGEQFVVRRTIYDRVRQAFAENGIEFFKPTVQVADSQQVAAQHAQQAGRAAKTPATA